MWIVANQIKGVLKFPGLNLEMSPGAECDLDLLGRDRAESSEQVKIAIENGYLRTVRKTLMMDEKDLANVIEDRIRAIKGSLVSEINQIFQEKGAQV